MTNGEKLRAWRERVGLSQDQAAKRVGTVQRTWAGWEKSTTPEVDYCEQIQELTGGEVSTKDWARSRRRKRRNEESPKRAA